MNCLCSRMWPTRRGASSTMTRSHLRSMSRRTPRTEWRTYLLVLSGLGFPQWSQISLSCLGVITITSSPCNQMGFKETHRLCWTKEPGSYLLYEQPATDAVLHQPATTGTLSSVWYHVHLACWSSGNFDVYWMFSEALVQCVCLDLFFAFLIFVARLHVWNFPPGLPTEMYRSTSSK